MKEQETKEHWMPAKFIRPDGSVLDFTGLYEVSDLGHVRSLKFRKTKTLKPLKNRGEDGNIYYHVHLRKDNKRHPLTVHRLVLSSFREGEFFEGAVCDHIVARTKTDCCNHLDNLRWVTILQNSSTEHHREIKSKKFINRKDLSKRVKVTFSDGTQKIFPSTMEVIRQLDLPHITVSQCIHKCNGYYKKLGIHFEYID